MFKPAHITKHYKLLNCLFNGASFQLAQSDNGDTNGSALWLGAQILSVYLADVKAINGGKGRRAIELGSGIGFSAYVQLGESISNC